MTEAVPVNLVRMTVLSTGSGTLALGPAVPAFRGMDALVDGNVYSYSIQQGANFEYGRGLYGASGGTLTRGVIGSSYGGAPILLTPNAIVVFPALAEDLQVPGPPGSPGTPGEPGGQGDPGPAGAGINMPVIVRTGDHTAQTADANTYQQFTNAADCTLTLPLNATIPIAIATVIAIEAHSTGKVTVAAAGGVTLNCRGGLFSTAGQYAVIQAKKIATDEWVLMGDVGA